jgi:hypothetical protein
MLGKWYLEGKEALSIKKDIDKAVKLFHRAAELGSAPAYNSLGVMHATGLGVIKMKQKLSSISKRRLWRDASIRDIIWAILMPEQVVLIELSNTG